MNDSAPPEAAITPIPTEPPELTNLREKLGAFLEANPVSELLEITSPKVGFAIVEPWGDETVAIEVTRRATDLLDVLNRVILPERYAAIWHKKRRAFEIIFTANPLPQASLEVVGRVFSFTHRGKAYQCEFKESSKDLLVLAEHSMSVGAASQTNHRNLGSFRNYVLSQKGGQRVKDARPISFWVTGFASDWNDDEVRDLANHLNFYMTYYDTLSPYILIHSPQSETASRQSQIRFAFDKFPSSITSKPIDDILLSFWTASRTGDPARRFLYNYQIIEYYANAYVEDNVKKALKRIIAAPNATSNLDQTAQLVVEALGESKMHDSQKIDALIQRAVDPKLLWREIERNIDFFAAPCNFDGGFSLQPLANKNWKASDFATNGILAFSGALRRIRNALAHGREQKLDSVVAPTNENLEKLQFWVPLAALTACEVMIFRDVA